jgi:predicted amidophosphoribosyltransferase
MVFKLGTPEGLREYVAERCAIPGPELNCVKGGKMVKYAGMPEVLCHECGKPVEETWMLYCGACWRKLNSIPAKREVKVLFDRDGHRYERIGARWIKKS